MPKKKNIFKKGMELPINTLVVVAVAVIILLGIVAFFIGGFAGSSEVIKNRQAFMNACSGWTQTGCNPEVMPGDLEEKFKIWQPVAELPDKDEDKKVFLAKQCGCLGARKKLCSERTALECTGDCELMTCLELGGTCQAPVDNKCPTGTYSVGNNNKGCPPAGDASKTLCCKSTKPAIVCKSK